MEEIDHLVENINQGSRKKTKQKRKTEVERENR